MTDANHFELEELAPDPPGARPGAGATGHADDPGDLAPVFDIPVSVCAVLGRTRVSVAELLSLGAGSVVELDRKVGEAVDVFVGGRLVARGEVVVADGRLGVALTEIVRDEG